MREFKSVNPLREVPRAEIAQMKREGWSDERVALHYKVSEDRVRSFRKAHHIPGSVMQKAAGAASLGRMLADREFIAISCDKGRESELFAGLRFTDHPAASVREPRFVGDRSEARSMVGCAAARCAE